MAVPSNTLQTYQSSNNAEDVSDIVMNISPMDTPGLMMFKKGKAEATYTEWPIESLTAVDTNNAVIEGDDATTDASTTPTRVGNYCQTMDKVFQVSTIQNAIHKYGVGDEFAKQKAKKGKELKRDMEAQMFANQARVVGAAGTAQKMRGIPSWYVTTANRGASGANGSATTAATDGTPRDFSEALFRATLVSAITNANDLPSVVMAGPANRANLSAKLSGNATRFYEVKAGDLNASITVYRSDYGRISFMMNRFQRERDMHFINPDYMQVRTLEPMSYQELARTGLSERGQMWTTFTVANLNEGAHAILADLNTAVLP